jgi:hypothetical protein
MSVSTTDVGGTTEMTKVIVSLMETTENIGGTTEMTKVIVSLMETTENIVGMIEMTKGIGTALRRGQVTRKTWIGTGIALSLSTAGIREAGCPQSTIAQNVAIREGTQASPRCSSA